MCLCVTLAFFLPDTSTMSHSCGTANEPALASQGKWALLSLEVSGSSIKQESQEYVALADMVFLGRACIVDVFGACVLISEQIAQLDHSKPGDKDFGEVLWGPC